MTDPITPGIFQLQDFAGPLEAGADPQEAHADKIVGPQTPSPLVVGIVESRDAILEVKGSPILLKDPELFSGQGRLGLRERYQRQKSVGLLQAQGEPISPAWPDLPFS